MQFFKHQMASDALNCEAVSAFDAKSQKYLTELHDSECNVVLSKDSAIKFAEGLVYDLAWNLEVAVAEEFRTEEMQEFIAAARARTLKVIIE